MKAYVLKGIGQLEYTDMPMPKLADGWALVQVGAAGICGSDLPRIYQTGTYHFPTVPGHEFAGRVVDVYSREDRAWIGKRVGIFPLIPCGKCFVCREGKYEMCRNYDYLGSRRDGGFAEYAAVPVWNLLELPDEMTMEEAAMLEPAAVALHALRRIQISPGDTVALFGLGTIGLIMTQWMHYRFGIKKVYAFGHNPEHGKKMKLTASEDYEYVQAEDVDEAAFLLQKTGGEGVQIAVECAGAKETLVNCLNSVRPGGQILAVGNPKGDMHLDKASYWKLLRSQICLAGTWNSSFCHSREDDWHQVIEACRKKELCLSELITHRLAFGELERGLSIAVKQEEYYNKIMICNPEVR